MRISHLCISSLLRSWIIICWTTTIAIIVLLDINCSTSAFVVQGGSLSRTSTTTTFSFVVVSKQLRRQLPTPTVKNEKTTATQLHLVVSLPDVSSAFHATDLVLPPCDSSILMLADGEAATGGTTWKQYVALGVILGVIIDILLGSPLAGAIAAPLRQQVEQVTGESLMDGTTTKKENLISNKKERVDSEAMAKDVLDKVRGQQELNDYLEKNKSPQQKMEELRRQLDQQFEN